MSVALPAGNGTSNMTGRAGYCSARAGNARALAAMPANAPANWRRFNPCILISRFRFRFVPLSAQRGLEYLAVRVARQAVGQERDDVRHLVVGEEFRAVRLQLRFLKLSCARHHARRHALAEDRVGSSD